MRERTLEERLRAVERAVTDADVPADDGRDGAEITGRIDDLEDRIADHDRRLEAVEAAVAAVRGYVGHINHVNRDVERTANAAVAAVDRLQAASGTPPELATIEDGEADADDGTDESPPASDPLPDDVAEPASDRSRSLLDVVRSIL